MLDCQFFLILVHLFLECIFRLSMNVTIGWLVCDSMFVIIYLFFYLFIYSFTFINWNFSNYSSFAENYISLGNYLLLLFDVASNTVQKTQFPTNLVTFTEEILNGKFHFLCSNRWQHFALLLEYYHSIHKCI